ncbi:hypothetical protein C8Q80DRAFT_276334 [Daedaleopsis nitida]|nr:hypothetical protein C8Q80DRAFT_276334 [Daedaleopsis nitida]
MKNRHTYRFSGLAHCLPQQGARTDQYLYLSPALPSTHSRQHVQRALLPAPTMGSYRSRECACADVPGEICRDTVTGEYPYALTTFGTAVRGSVHLRALPRNQPASRPRPPTHVAKPRKSAILGTRILRAVSRMYRQRASYHAPNRFSRAGSISRGLCTDGTRVSHVRAPSAGCRSSAPSRASSMGRVPCPERLTWTSCAPSPTLAHAQGTPPAHTVPSRTRALPAAREVQSSEGENAVL